MILCHPFAHQLWRTALLTHLTAQGLAICALIWHLLSAHAHQRFLSSFDDTIPYIKSFSEEEPFFFFP
jgi:hypothetical protein